MARPKRFASLELEDDIGFNEWQWRVSTALFWLLVAIIVAASVGVFGSGPLSRARAGEVGGPLWVEYDRLVRFGATARMTVHTRPQPDGTIRLTVGHPLLHTFRVEQITPAPERTTVTVDGIEYSIRADAAANATVTFDLQPIRRWRTHGDIRSPDAAVRVRQFVLP